MSPFLPESSIFISAFGSSNTNNKKMAFRTAGCLKSTMMMMMMNRLRGIGGGGSISNFTTSTSPKFKAFTPTADPYFKSPEIKSKASKGDMVPVCVALGMVTLSVSFGLYTAYHQLGHAPNVFVKKSKRETVPEVVEPEQAAEAAERFVKQSFFRKVAHIQEHGPQEVMPDPIRGDVFNRPVKVETLKDVGVESKPN